MKSVINIFDFDNTIYRSPQPRRDLYDDITYESLLSHWESGGLGWWQNVRTMYEKYTDYDNVIESTISHVRDSMHNPDAITILLTGRISAYVECVTNITCKSNLSFDLLSFKPLNTGEYTEDFKLRKIKEWIATFNPSCVNMWEDRESHKIVFEEYLNELNIKSNVTLVTGGEGVVYTPELELELVDKLKQDRLKNILPII